MVDNIKKPTIGKFIKGTGLAGLVYELGKEVLKIENAMPTDKEERELFRKSIIVIFSWIKDDFIFI